ncbi:sigma-70 family RNA polymerase sigma factor [Bacillus sp. BGMRC 2118]|nr:sigma-70 family RNA polymerase sigma factor [Bacillus sp. BGMRC 2118]
MELEDIYKLQMNDLYRYLFSLSKDHYIAEDLVQEAFLRAYMTLEEYEIQNIKAWLFKVAYHAFIDYTRKNKRAILTREVKEQATDAINPEKKVLENESLSLLLEDLKLLQENEKQAILLCDLHELTYEEATEVLGLKLNTFKSHLYRGRKKLMAKVVERMRKDEGRE